MPLKKNQDLTDMVNSEIMPIEHSGGDGWTILHGDAPRIIRSFRPGVFDAVITDPPYASGGWKPSEKNRGLVKRRPESLQGRRAHLPVHRLAAVPFHHRRFAARRLGVERRGGLGQADQPPPERTVPPAERIHCVGV